MEGSIRVEAKTAEAAVIEAAKLLSATEEDIEYEVIEKGNSGFLGFGSKPCVIEARVKAARGEVSAPEAEVVQASAEKKAAPADKDELKNRADSFLKSVFEKMEIEVELESSYNDEDECLEINMKGEDMGSLIGKRGQTLNSLQYLTSLVVNKHSQEYTRVKLDTENYRERRKETLENLAMNVAYKVKRTKRSIKLEPMNPYERRIIHSALQSDRYVTTKSEGEEPYRHVVVSLKRDRKY